MKHLITLFCLSVLLLVSCQRNPEKNSADAFQSMIVSNELSNQRIKAFAEDSLGHIWIGTFRGLNRYNSIDYHQFFCTDSCIDLPDNQINSLYNDSRNRLWIATINGIAIYDNNGHFHNISHAGHAVSDPAQILESNKKQIFVNFITHLDLYDEEKKELKTVLPSMAESSRINLTCHFDRRNKLWVIDNRNLRCFQPDTFGMIDSIHLPSPIQTHFMDIGNDQLWLGGLNYLALYDTRDKKMLPLPPTLANNHTLANANIINIHKYEEGYWLFNTSDKGLIVYNSANDKIWEERENGYPFELPGFHINSFFTDSNKNLWVGSYDQGVAIINKFQRVFNSDIALNSFVSRRSINSVDLDTDGNLWMAAAFDGLFLYNLNSSEALFIDPRQISASFRDAPYVSLVKATKDGHIWLASLAGNKVWRCKWSGDKLIALKDYDLPAPLSMTEDSQGALWIGSGQKWLSRYNVLTDRFDSAEVGFGPGGNCFVSGLANAGDKVFVAAFRRPLMQAKFVNNEIKIDSVGIPEWDKLILRGQFMPTDMLLDSFGDLWIGTVGNGLIRYNPESKQLSRVSEVPCTDIAALEEDKQGHIWISTQFGLARYARNSGRIQTYYTGDGIGGNQFYDRSSVMTPKGTLFFGGTHGVTSFNPIDIGSKNRMRLVFEDLKIHNSIIDPLKNPDNMKLDLGLAKEVNLKRGENSFSISFAALDYTSFVKPRFSYILENHDPYWIEGRNTNEASYSNLRPGKYTLKVRLTDDNETLIGEELSIPIHVEGNPWTSWWAWIIYILAAVTVIYVVVIQIQGIHLKLKLEKLPAKTSPADEDKPAMSASDLRFIEELQQLMETEIANPDIDVNRITKMMRISRTKLYYKVKSLTGQNPSAYFKNYKLERAAKLLKEGKYTVWEIAEMTGYSTTAHFSTSFKKKFGKTPTEYSR